MTQTIKTERAHLDSIEIERSRRLLSRANDGSESEDLLRETLDNNADLDLRSKVLAAYRFARNVEYEHAGLSKMAYLAHPVRLTCMVLKLLPGRDENAAVLAMLHNLLEVSKICEVVIAKQFGAHIADAMRVLTVDRTQASAEYTASYYARLERTPSWVRVVKVLDKVDNLFVLCLNSNAQTREAYLKDIERFVLPMAALVLPHIASYMRALIDDCRRVGFLNAEAAV